jgi:hypothetical protein
LQQELDDIRAKKSERAKALNAEQNMQSVAAFLTAPANDAGSEKSPVSPLRCGGGVLARFGESKALSETETPLERVGSSRTVSAKEAVLPRPGGAVADCARGKMSLEIKADMPQQRTPGLRVVLSSSCVKQPKVSLVPQSVTLAELTGSYGLGCIIAPELRAPMDWRGKHVQKGTPAYTSAKFVISRAHELMKTELSNPQAELWQPGPPGRGFVSPILYVDSSNQSNVYLHADCCPDGKLTF